MQTSRRLIMALSGAAVVASCVPAAVLNYDLLTSAKAVLLPKLTSVLGVASDVIGVTIEADIVVDAEYQCLIVKAWRDGVEPAGFAITAEAIKDGVYVAQFYPTAYKLRDIIAAGGLDC